MSKLSSFWRGKVVLLTGASSGLGEAVVDALAPFGVKFCLLSRRLDRMEAIRERHLESESSFFIRSVDVSQREQVESAVTEFVRDFGAIDIAWINSGVGASSPFHAWDWDGFERMVDVNFKGAVYAVHSALQSMVPRGEGHIVAISSAAAMRPMPTRVVYSASKIALDAYIEGLSLEQPQIQFTLIHPGFVDTDINRGNPGRVWLMQPPEAAQVMIRSVASGKRWTVFPVQMRVVYALVQRLPWWLYRWLITKFVGKFRK